MTEPRQALTPEEAVELLRPTLESMRPRRFVSIESYDGAFADHVNLDDGSVLRVHPRSICEPPCAVHAPSEHPLRDAPRQWRADARLIERVCPHGVGHPDPDGIRYERIRSNADSIDVHGCDGCCAGEGPG